MVLGPGTGTSNPFSATVDKEFATLESVAAVTLFLAAFKMNALTGKSICLSHGWHLS